MTLFCTEFDLAIRDPVLFSEPSLQTFAVVREADATLTGTTLVAAALAGVAPGMAAQLVRADGSRSLLAEVVSVAGAQATVSMPRVSSECPAIAPPIDGAVKLTILNLRPHIAAAGAALLAILGLTEVDPVPEGIATATIFGALELLWSIADTDGKRDITLRRYSRLAQITRRALHAVRQDGAPVDASLITLRRT